MRHGLALVAYLVAFVGGFEMDSTEVLLEALYEIVHCFRYLVVIDIQIAEKAFLVDITDECLRIV
jgi:hypothetical protein